ncbi:MAG: DUF2232 domain-containing protein [Longimicrobiales bacterium]|nr:DUF2232 domain-containing protein [Longimicrobiales bacterium]
MTDVAPVLPAAAKQPKGWPRAVALMGVAMATAVLQPSVLVAVPFLLLGFVLGVRRLSVVAASVLAAVVVAAGEAQTPLWYVERGWAFLAGGWFAALTLRQPRSAFSGRALGAVAGAAVVAGVVLGTRSGAWSTVEWAVEERIAQGIGTALEALRFMRGGEALPPSLVTAVQETVRTQSAVFPALLGVSSMAALGVAWWVYVRLSSGSDQGVGPLREFRFNDHLVWVFIAGLVLLVAQWQVVLSRVGANTVVFMGALYAVRGAAVILFLSGGLSLFGYVMLAFGLVFLPPLVLTGAMVIGIGDTWLDVRRRAGPTAA